MKIAQCSLLAFSLIMSGLTLVRAEGFAPIEISDKDEQEVTNPKLQLTGTELAVLRLAACKAAKKDNDRLQMGLFVKHSVYSQGYECSDPSSFKEAVSLIRRWYDSHGKTKVDLTVDLENGKLWDKFSIYEDDLSVNGPQPHDDISIKSSLAQKIAQEEIDFWVNALGSQVDAKLKKAAEKAVSEAQAPPAEVKVENVAADASIHAFNESGSLSGLDSNSFGHAADGTSKP